MSFSAGSCGARERCGSNRGSQTFSWVDSSVGSKQKTVQLFRGMDPIGDQVFEVDSVVNLYVPTDDSIELGTSTDVATDEHAFLEVVDVPDSAKNDGPAAGMPPRTANSISATAGTSPSGAMSLISSMYFQSNLTILVKMAW